MAAILKARGWKEVTYSIFQGDVKDIGLCQAIAPREVNPARREPARNTFATFTPEKRRVFGGNAMTLENYNAPENFNGDYLFCLITSYVGREGVNSNNVTEYDMTSAKWNEASAFQARFRVIRASSHQELIDHLHRVRAAQGILPAQYLQERIAIKIYQHAALPFWSATPALYLAWSYDCRLYLISETKDILIRDRRRLLKRVAVDCLVNKQRNTRASDTPGSAGCDYQSCEYECYEPAVAGTQPGSTSVSTTSAAPLPFMDYTNWDILYSKTQLGIIKDQIRQLFQLNGYARVTIEELRALVAQGFRPHLFDLAVAELVNEREILSNRYGEECYFLLKGGVLYLVGVGAAAFLPGLASAAAAPLAYWDAEYNEQYYFVERGELKDIKIEADSGRVRQLLDQLVLAGNNYQSFVQIIRTYSIPERAGVLEAAVVAYSTGTLDQAAIPLWLFELLRKYFTKYVKLMVFKDPISGGSIWVHTIRSTEATTGYNEAAARRGAMGDYYIYPAGAPSEWHRGNDSEKEHYRPIFQKAWNDLVNTLRVNGYYGIIKEATGRFSIVDVEHEKFKASSNPGKSRKKQVIAGLEGVDVRFITTGRECGGWTLIRLIDVLWRLNQSFFSDERFMPTIGNRKMVMTDFNTVSNAQLNDWLGQLIRQKVRDPTQKNPPEQWTPLRVAFYHYWFGAMERHNVQLCEFLQQVLEEKEWFLE